MASKNWRLGTALSLAATTMLLTLVGIVGGQGNALGATLTQAQKQQKWCGPGGRLCYDPTTTRWTWKKKRRN